MAAACGARPAARARRAAARCRPPRPPDAPRGARAIRSLSWPSATELAQLRVPTLHADLAALANRHGPVFGLPLGEVNAVVIGDADLAEHVLSPRRAGRAFGYRWEDPRHLPFAAWGELLGASARGETSGVFFGNGPRHWAPARRACERGLLQGRAVRAVGEAAAAQAAASLAGRWAAAGARADDVHPAIREATLDVVSHVAFGGPEALDAAARRELGEVYAAATAALERLAGVPNSWWWVLRRGAAAELRGSAERLQALLLPRLRERRGAVMAAREAQTAGPSRCIVDLLLEADLPEGVVIHNAMQILGAGHDTTATTLALLLWRLALDGDLQDSVRAELRGGATASAAAGAPGGAAVGGGATSPLLSASVREILRLWPAAPLIVRQALEPVPAWRGLEIPAGTVAIVAPWLLGRSALHWDAPGEFRPRRHLEALPGGGGRGASASAHAFSWIPFGYGVRSCVGQHLAVAELEAFAAALLGRLRFSSAGQPPEVEWFLTLRLRGGLTLRVEPIA